MTMTQITAYQHVFSSVDRDQSPTRRRGYQTLFYTRAGLSEAEIQALEDRAQYYTSDAMSVKRQFFWLPGGKGVISQVVPLAELDEFGRRGRYLSHSLILTTEQWEKLEFSPFDLLSTAPFLTMLAAAFKQGDLQTGDISTVSFAVSQTWKDKALALARTWPIDHLLRLAKLAWRGQSIVNERQFVALIGTPEQILEILSVAFLLIPPPDRRFCSFDTYAHGCDWTKQAAFWGQGFADASEARTSLVVDAGARRVKADGYLQAGTTPYERWVERMAIPGRLDGFLTNQDWALVLDGIIEGQSFGARTLSRIDPKFMGAFSELNADTIRARITEMLPANLSPGLVRTLLAELGDSAFNLLGWLVRGLTSYDLAEHLFNVFSQRAVELPSKEERRALADLTGSHSALRYLLSLWAQDVGEWRKSLLEMPDQEYRQRIVTLLDRGVISTWQAIAPNHIDAWFDVCASYLRPGEITRVAAGLAECGSERDIQRLAEIVPRLISSDQKALSKWLKSSRKKAPALRVALERVLGKPESALERLKRRVFGRLSQENPKIGRKGRRR